MDQPILFHKPNKKVRNKKKNGSLHSLNQTHSSFICASHSDEYSDQTKDIYNIFTLPNVKTHKIYSDFLI
jgi:hypothetical protein